MHTVKVIAGGLVVLAAFLGIGRWAGGGLATAAAWFIPIWLIAAAVNLWFGVARAGYSLAEEMPFFAAVFGVPAAAAALVWWRYSGR